MSTTLATGISATATSLTVAAGHGADFTLPAGDYCWLSIDQGGVTEIVLVTALSVDTFTLGGRGQHGTRATAFTAGAVVDLAIPSPLAGVVPTSSLTAAVTFTQDGAGAVPRLVTDKLKESVSVTDFGADSTGVLDASTAIQNAIASLPTHGGRIIFPAGTFLVGTVIDLTTKPVILEGIGWRSLFVSSFGSADWTGGSGAFGTVLKVTGTNGAIRTSGTYPYYHEIKNLAVIGPGSGTSIGIDLGQGNSNTYLRTENVLVANFYKGVRFNDALDHAHRILSVRGCTYGLYFEPTGAVTDFQFFRLNIEGCTTAIYASNSTMVSVFGGLIQANTDGIVFRGGASQWSLYGLWMEANTHAFSFDTTVSAIQDVNFTNCLVATAFTVPIAVVTGSINGLCFHDCNMGAVTMTMVGGMNDISITGSTKFNAVDPSGAERVSIQDRSAGTFFSSFASHNLGNLGASLSLDARDGFLQHGSITQALTINVPNHCPGDAMSFELRLRQDGTGGFAITMGSGFHGTLSNTGNTAFLYTVLRMRQLAVGQWWFEQIPYFS